MPVQPFKPRTEQPKVKAKEYPPSETVQEDAMEVKEIFGRYNTPMPEKAYPFFDVDDLNDISKLHSQNIDLVDLQDLQEKTSKMTAKINEKIKAHEDAKTKTEGQDLNTSDTSNDNSGVDSATDPSS